MVPIFLSLLIPLMISASVISRTFQASQGIILSHHSFQSEYVDPRRVDVWLPGGYDGDSSATYPVLYMHDGQNLFDGAASYIGVEWEIDETMEKLIATQQIGPAIVVGIWNTPKRLSEYMPQMVYHLLSDSSKSRIMTMGGEAPMSDRYLQFIVRELKPFVDSTYRTKRDRNNTVIMGSSMGGLISLYALTEYPDVFGRAGCVSTHWPITEDGMLTYLTSHLPQPGTHRIYFDYGTETLDSLYEPYQLRVDSLMQRSGYVESEDWITRKFEGDEHSERAWKKRVDVPLKFLLRKENKK